MKEFASKSFRGRHEFTYMSRLSRASDRARSPAPGVENRRGGSSPVDPSPADSPRGGATVERLLEILSEPIASPALRAAAFDALAEIPGIGFERDVADAAGRQRRRDRLGQGTRIRPQVHLRSPHRQDPRRGRNDLRREGRGYPGVPAGTLSAKPPTCSRGSSTPRTKAWDDTEHSFSAADPDGARRAGVQGRALSDPM